MRDLVFRTISFLPVLLVGAGACSSPQPGEIASEELLGLEADQVMVKLETSMTREGLRRAHLLADTGYTYQDEARLNLRDLEITFFADGGQPEGVLTAVSGVYELESGDISVEGRVVVVDAIEGKRLTTEKLRYVAASDSLYGDTVFTFFRGNAEMRGSSFVSDPGLDNIRAVSPSVVVPDVQVIR